MCAVAVRVAVRRQLASRHPIREAWESSMDIKVDSQVVESNRKMKAARVPFAVVGLGAMALSVAGCATVVSQDQIGVRDTLGKLSDEPSSAGLKLFLWPIWDITKLSTRTVNLEVQANLPSKEGLTIESVVSILYRLKPELAGKVLAEIGKDYEASVILPVFRSAIADVSARYAAKDMHTSKRAEIEVAVKEQMGVLLAERGFAVEAVLLKSIRLPANLSQSIERRLQAEQNAKRMLFVLEQEQREAKRKRIEAEGIRDAQQTLADGLTEDVLRLRAIQAMTEISKSPNAKIIITDGTPNVLIDQTK